MFTFIIRSGSVSRCITYPKHAIQCTYIIIRIDRPFLYILFYVHNITIAVVREHDNVSENYVTAVALWGKRASQSHFALDDVSTYYYRRAHIICVEENGRSDVIIFKILLPRPPACTYTHTHICGTCRPLGYYAKILLPIITLFKCVFFFFFFALLIIRYMCTYPRTTFFADATTDRPLHERLPTTKPRSRI